MRVIGTGVDIIEVERVRGVIERRGELFLCRVYLKEEIEYCRSGANSYQRFATRFAAKEAVLKALGVGWQQGTCFTDIKVVKDSGGAPSVELCGESLKISEKLGVEKLHISLSHTARYAVAQAVAEG